MIYGFISSLDDEITKVFFRSKKIRGNNIYNAGSLGKLSSVLQSGDVVYTVSCNRIASVRQVYTFARFCHKRGIILHFVAEPYLDMGNDLKRKQMRWNLLQKNFLDLVKKWQGIGVQRDGILTNIQLEIL